MLEKNKCAKRNRKMVRTPPLFEKQRSQSSDIPRLKFRFVSTFSSFRKYHHSLAGYWGCCSDQCANSLCIPLPLTQYLLPLASFQWSIYAWHRCMLQTREKPPWSLSAASQRCMHSTLLQHVRDIIIITCMSELFHLLWFCGEWGKSVFWHWPMPLNS